MLHNTAVKKEWTTKWPYIANGVFSRIVKMLVNKVTFVGFRGGDRPPGSAPCMPCMFRCADTILL